MKRELKITKILNELLSTTEGRKCFAESVHEFFNAPLRKTLKPIDWSKMDWSKLCKKE